ncbi:gluconolactonase, putative [Roseibium aggregatum IAM 12614]|uniref:Gluconolactonase, putative n=1 Tax=Roseibium aggregatum (strain ATCC 25650 / DSM 13394 / JCM 20685 / NBRC 16684 / NCIMB 2208 / IAM 12614 / B1) TaxID=384765 RepID=A0NZE7_ROSAI|nr:SMP-30/gluconolactonase/LRE family protein [Roseibium aggregatum]EAV41826.1 gluconolactonase, putative [Roseibium aggregatum IAM 12614]
MFGVLEGTGFEVIEPEFEDCFIGHARVERLWTGARWSEGPAWFPAGRYLVWSDIPNNRLMRWDETDGSVSVFRSPSNNANGNTVDTQGRLVSCEHLTRRVTRTDHDGSLSVIASHWNGKRLNSPNDVVVKSDGSVWFTDPSYGIMMDYEGDRAESEIGACHVYRADPTTGDVTAVATDFVKPNGLAFSADEQHLFIADTGGTHQKNGPAHIRKFEVADDGKSLRGGDVLATCTNGFFDGFRLDRSGRIWTSAADGVHCLNRQGTLIGKVHIPEIVSNVCFGGAKLNRLFITGTTSLYSVFLNVNGVSR